MGTTALLVASLAAAAAQTYNTQQTAKKQDRSAADAIRRQSELQRQADARVAQEVTKTEGSSSADEKATALDQYVKQLQRQKATTEGSLNMPTEGVLSSVFGKESAEARSGVEDFGQRTAGLMSRIDAPAYQRQGEAFGYGNLGVDLGMIGRQSRGQQWIDDLRMRSIRRNPWIDAFSSALGGAAGAAGSGGGGGGGGGLSPYGGASGGGGW